MTGRSSTASMSPQVSSRHRSSESVVKPRLTLFALVAGLLVCAVYFFVGWTAAAEDNLATRIFLDPPFYAVGLFRHSDAPLWGLVISLVGLIYSFVLGGIVGVIIGKFWSTLRSH